MRSVRLALALACLTAVAAWSDATVSLNVTSLDPQGPYRAGQQVHVVGAVAYNDLPRPWGGGGRMTTQTRHAVNVALEVKRDLDDDWPEVPDMRSARGDLHFYDGTGFSDFEQKHGAASDIWSQSVTPPARTQRTDPMNHRDEIPFEADFTIPDDCIAARLRAQLESTVGANWFVTHFRYDYSPVEMDVPGIIHVPVTCEREPYQKRTRTVTVSDQTDKVTISGQVRDARWQPIHRAKITAGAEGKQVDTLTDADGRYTLSVTLCEDMVLMSKIAAGTLQTASKSCDFRLDTPADLVTIRYRVTAPGYEKNEGSFSLRVPFDTKTVWVLGNIVHKDADSVRLAAEGKITEYHKIDRGTIMLNGPKGQNTFDFHFGWFVGYVPVGDTGSGEIRTRRLLLLEPDPNTQVPGTPGQAGSDTLSLSSSRRIMERLWNDADPTLRENWMRLGFVIAMIKDATSPETAVGGFKNAREFLDRWESGDAQKLMHNAVWTLKESVGMAQGKLIPSGPEDMAQLTKKLYNDLRGQGHTIPDSPEGASAALKQMVIHLNETRQTIQGVQ